APDPRTCSRSPGAWSEADNCPQAPGADRWHTRCPDIGAATRGRLSHPEHPDVRRRYRPSVQSPDLPLGSVGAWPGRDDGDLQPAICVDVVRQTVPDGDWGHPARDPDHLFAADRVADMALAIPGLADIVPWCSFF